MKTIFLLITAITLPSVAVAEKVTYTVSAGKFDRRYSIVTAPLPSNPTPFLKQMNLVSLDSGRSVPCQLSFAGNPKQLVWILDEPLAAGKTRKYEMRSEPAKKRTLQTVQVIPGKKDYLSLQIGKREILRYNYALIPSPIKGKPYYRRSGYIHPVFNPAGQMVTDDFSPDHPHQHGIMYPWQNTRFEGRSLNFWEQTPGMGAGIYHSRIKSIVTGPVYGGLFVELKHLERTGKEFKPVLTEDWDLIAYRFEKEFIFDLVSKQRCATKSPLKILKFHYGGLAIRGHREWTKKYGNFLTSAGKTRRNGNHSRPRWVDINGPVKGKTTGMTVFCHPQNFRFPQAVRLHPAMPYFCFAPMVNGSWSIEPGKPYRTKYRFYVHMGKLDVNRAESIWNDYAHPLKVTIGK